MAFFSRLKKMLVLYIEKVYTYLRFGGGFCISISELAQNPPPFLKSEGYTSGFYFCLNGGFSLQNLRWFCSVSVT